MSPAEAIVQINKLGVRLYINKEKRLEISYSKRGEAKTLRRFDAFVKNHGININEIRDYLIGGRNVSK